MKPIGTVTRPEYGVSAWATISSPKPSPLSLGCSVRPLRSVRLTCLASHLVSNI